jgi:hypothetical protein
MVPKVKGKVRNDDADFRVLRVDAADVENDAEMEAEGVAPSERFAAGERAGTVAEALGETQRCPRQRQ